MVTPNEELFRVKESAGPIFTNRQGGRGINKEPKDNEDTRRRMSDPSEASSLRPDHGDDDDDKDHKKKRERVESWRRQREARRRRQRSAGVPDDPLGDNDDHHHHQAEEEEDPNKNENTHTAHHVIQPEEVGVGDSQEESFGLTTTVTHSRSARFQHDHHHHQGHSTEDEHIIPRMMTYHREKEDKDQPVEEMKKHQDSGSSSSTSMEPEQKEDPQSYVGSKRTREADPPPGSSAEAPAYSTTVPAHRRPRLDFLDHEKGTTPLTAADSKNTTLEEKDEAPPLPSDHHHRHHHDDLKNNNDHHHHDNNGDGDPQDPPAANDLPLTSLEQRAVQHRHDEEERIWREATQLQQRSKALQAAREVAQGVLYDRPMPSSWRPPTRVCRPPDGGPKLWQKQRRTWHMEIQGAHVPPPLERFEDMKLPQPILNLLQSKGIRQPTPIQIQGLPVALAGRDMIGIAFTGSGKTLTFALPLVMAALEEELRMPLVPGEGPVGIILAPSRELARQTHEWVREMCETLAQTPGYPTLRSQLIMGGESVRDQVQVVREHGVHCVVATPGRLRDVLKRQALNLLICRYICLDEADRMLDMGFDEEVGEIMNHFTRQRQTLLFSATFPQKFQDFARKTLVQPVVVNVGRAGAANLDVIQEVEYVKNEAKIVYLLHCLQKTAPPVIIFCERKGAADDIHEYLLLKGVEAVSIHGGKDQEERNEAIRLFKAGQKDVLIATDVAAKGLDFPAIQHVINFDMPEEIENYVHRIGRTGRAGKTGVATTFINKDCSETTLLDLKALLKEARQRIPPVLMMLEDPREQANNNNNNGAAGLEANAGGCSFCGGLGHTIIDCPKIDKDARRVAGSHKDVLKSGGGDW